MNIENYIKKAFTLPEIMIATFISVIILSFIFVFIWNIMIWISGTKNEIEVMSSFYDFTNKLNNYRNVYITWWILVDSITDSDVFLLEDIQWENGILIWPIDINDRTLNLDTTQYYNKWLGFRKISSTELADIDLNINNIYNYTFQSDQIFSDLKLQNMVLIEYNSWSVYDLTLTVNIDYQSSLIGQKWSELPIDTLRKFNINF